MSQAEKEFVKWFIDRFSRMPVDTDADNGMKEAFCNAYNLGVMLMTTDLFLLIE